MSIYLYFALIIVYPKTIFLYKVTPNSQSNPMHLFTFIVPRANTSEAMPCFFNYAFAIGVVSKITFFVASSLITQLRVQKQLKQWFAGHTCKEKLYSSSSLKSWLVS